MDDLLRSKTAEGPDPNSQPQEQGRDGELSDDSVHSCSLPSRYLPAPPDPNSTNSSIEAAQESLSHSPVSDMAGMDSLSHSPEQPPRLQGLPGAKDKDEGDERVRKTSPVDKMQRPAERRKSEKNKPIAQASYNSVSGDSAVSEGKGRRDGGSKNTTPFRSRIPRRIHGSSSSTHNLPLDTSSPKRTAVADNGHTPIKRHMGTIQLRKSSSPAVLESSQVDGKHLIDDMHDGGAPRSRQPLRDSVGEERQGRRHGRDESLTVPPQKSKTNIPRGDSSPPADDEYHQQRLQAVERPQIASSAPHFSALQIPCHPVFAKPVDRAHRTHTTSSSQSTAQDSSSLSTLEPTSQEQLKSQDRSKLTA